MVDADGNVARKAACAQTRSCRDEATTGAFMRRRAVASGIGSRDLFRPQCLRRLHAQCADRGHDTREHAHAEHEDRKTQTPQEGGGIRSRISREGGNASHDPGRPSRS